jgi:hypothetical protein
VKANFKQASTDDLVANVGAGLIRSREVLIAVYPGLKQQRKAGGRRSRRRADQPCPRQGPKRAIRGQEGERQIAITGLIPGMAVHFARCCHPLPGDRIVGIITTGKGVTIHTIDCATLESFSDTPERWIDVGWEAVGDGGRGLYRPAQDHRRQPAGQPVEPVDGDCPARGQHLQPAHRQPFDGFLRHGDRCRGRRREAPRRHHGGAARDARINAVERARNLIPVRTFQDDKT